MGEHLILRPLSGWPGALTTERKRAPFRATYSATKALLLQEASLLRNGGRYWLDVVVHLAIEEADLRRDGALRANARPSHPGVQVIVPDADHLALHTDRYTHWHDNLRAIAKSMEALRAVDRWGVAQGRQYAGFRQIGAGIEMPEHTMTVEEAARFIAEWSGLDSEHNVLQIIDSQNVRNHAYRLAARQLHPDAGGDAAKFARLEQAREVIERHG